MNSDLFRYAPFALCDTLFSPCLKLNATAMKHILGLFLLVLAGNAVAQQVEEGVVTYERKTKWIKQMNKMTFLSREEKDRMAQTWKNDEEGKEKMKLSFSPTESLYTQAGDPSDNGGGYSWRTEEFILYRNFAQETRTDIIEMLGKTYIVGDSLRPVTWKIGNQVKEVAGYFCTKAETEDPIKQQKITAWFAQDIPVAAGPEQYSGLPGLILELDLDDDVVVIEAVKVEAKKLTDAFKLPKTKGKKITAKEYDTILQRYITESIAARRNPYWTVRY